MIFKKSKLRKQLSKNFIETTIINLLLIFILADLITVIKNSSLLIKNIKQVILIIKLISEIYWSELYNNFIYNCC